MLFFKNPHRKIDLLLAKSQNLSKLLYNEFKHNILSVASMHSLVSAVQKEERKNDKQRGTNNDKKKKNYNWGLLGNNKDEFQFHFNINMPCW